MTATKRKMPADPNRRAKVVADAMESILDDEAPLKDGRASGAKGGHARAEKLNPERRREIARKAARARWERHET